MKTSIAILALALGLTVTACSKESSNSVTGAGLTETDAAAAPAAPKPGLWELSTSTEGMPQKVTTKLCFGQTAPGASAFGPPPSSSGGKPSCSKNEVNKTAEGYSINSECAVNGMTIATTGTVTGDMNSAYTVDMSVSMKGASLPAAMQKAIKSKVEAKYLGDCPAGVNPGQTAK